MLEFFYTYQFVIVILFAFLVALLIIFIMRHFNETSGLLVAVPVSMIIELVGFILSENYLDKTYKPYYVSQLIYKRSEVECTGKYRSNCGSNFVFTIRLSDGRIVDQNVNYYTYRHFNEGSTIVFYPSMHEVSRRDLWNVVKYVDNKDQTK
jgi:hypothetical protein